MNKQYKTNVKVVLRMISSLIVVYLMSLTISASEFNFSVETVQPATQIDKSKTYFDMQVEPGVAQDLVIHLRNDTDNDVEIAPEIASATTNTNGVVEYSKNKIKKDSSLKYDLSDIVKTEKTIVIPKKGNYDLHLTVTPPYETFDGVIAGGITLEEKRYETEETETDSQGLAIKNYYSYVVGIVLHSNQTLVTPDLIFKKAYPSQENARNVIMNELQNPMPTYINNVKIIGEVTHLKDKETAFTVEQDNMQIAPNTLFSFPIGAEGRKLKPGKHESHLVVYANRTKEGPFEYGKDEDGHPIHYQNKWEFSQEFTISKEKAKTYNKKDVTIKEDYTMWYVVGGLLLIILALIIWIIWQNRKEKHVKED